MLTLPFQPGLTFRFQYMDFFADFSRPFARAKNASSVSETGIRFSALAETFSM